MLATIGPDGRPRLVPLAFAVNQSCTMLYSALDEKPKAIADPRLLARVRDIQVRPRVSVLVDHWSEDWTELAWLRLEGTARLIEPRHAEHAIGVNLLRARYPQYAAQRLEQRPLLRMDIERITGWNARE